MHQRIRLDAITFDAGTQIRAAIDQQVVADYAERMSEGIIFPAVVLFHDGNRYYMADGFHRGLAANRIGFKDIEADVRPGTTVEALWYALGANKTNGHQMTIADKRHAILLAVRTWPDLGPAVIAEQIGCTDRWVREIRSEVTSDLPKKQTGKDGKSYPAKRESKPVAATEVNPAATVVMPATTHQARKSSAVEGASKGLLKRLPKKGDAEIVTNVVQALRGILSVFESVDPAPLSSHPDAEEWRAVVAETISVLRSFNKRLERKAV